MKTYKKGDTIEGKVTGFLDYGIFLAYENGYTGLIHISELSNHFVKSVEDYAKIGEVIPAVILEIDENSKQIKCTIKNTEFGNYKDMFIDHGFAPLKKQLPIWMDEKLKDIPELNIKNNRN